MLEHNPFIRDDVMPSWWANAIQRALSTFVSNFRVELASATSIRVPAAADEAAVVVTIQGRWRWVEADVTRAHPGGAAGEYVVWAVAADNDIVNTPDPGTDVTDYAFDLRITDGADPTGVDLFQEVARLDWDGSAITRIYSVRGLEALDVNLWALAGLDSEANKLPYFSGDGEASTTDLTAAARALLDDADAAAMRATLGLIIGTHVQAQDADLTAIAALSTTPFGRGILELANAAALRSAAGLVIGTDVQAQDATLAALAGLVVAANKIIYATGADAFATADLAPWVRTNLLGVADAVAAREALGVGDEICRMTRSASQAIPHNTNTQVTLNQLDTVGGVSVENGIQVQEAGWYIVSFYGEFTVAGNNARGLWVERNGSRILGNVGPASSSTEVALTGATMLQLAAGDKLKLWAFQNNGPGTLDLNVPTLCCAKLSD